MGSATSVCLSARRSAAKTRLGSTDSRLSRQVLADILSECREVEEWKAVRCVSRRFKRCADSRAEVDISIDWEMKCGARSVRSENMVFAIYSDLYIGGKHVLERHDDVDSLAWLWPTVPLRSISIHCFHLASHASINDFTLHHEFLSEIATFLERVPERCLRSLKKFEIATQDSFSSYFMCPEYTIPQFKRIVRRLPENMESIELQTFPSNEGLVASLLGLKPKKLLILGDETILEDSLDFMKHNHSTTLFIHMRELQDHELVLKAYDSLTQIWKDSPQHHENSVHVEFGDTRTSTAHLERKISGLTDQSCVHSPSKVCKVNCNVVSRYGIYCEVTLSLKVEETSLLKKTKKEVRGLNLLERNSVPVLNNMPDYQLHLTNDSSSFDSESDSGISLESEESQMEEIDLSADLTSTMEYVEFDEHQRLLISAPGA
ncbi:hypothetical protein QR680_006493 [Steinernema hermaphroditum]|uniref:F-box domain-containing protein n=1 Tax=Steinernema hermaphroditum TaxID=289476 RepID=A0AA39HVR9_9BILA|nr:hypothetical protein QR680_006493 [Steinernema hermaphroditum]